MPWAINWPASNIITGQYSQTNGILDLGGVSYHYHRQLTRIDDGAARLQDALGRDLSDLMAVGAEVAVGKVVNLKLPDPRCHLAGGFQGQRKDAGDVVPGPLGLILGGAPLQKTVKLL